jgi:hypothetical protein
VVTVSGWRKSSHSFSNGNCAEVAAWRKSSHSAYNGNCAEVGQDGAVVGVRDSQDPGGPVLVFGPVAWVAFLAGLRGVDTRPAATYSH